MKYCCLSCSRCWNYHVDTCIFCAGSVIPVEESEYRVIGSSEVFIPSTGNEKVPYYVNLLEDRQGHKIIQKTFEKRAIGDVVGAGEETRQHQKIGIVGTGLLGSQLATYFLQYGYPVTIKTRSEETRQKIYSKIHKQLSKMLDSVEVDKVCSLLTITTSYDDFASCDLVVEAAAEEIGIKREIFRELSAVCRSSTILATNSSSLSIDDLASVTDRPGQCIGMHFFNPVHRMDLVEVVIGKTTSGETREIICDLVTALNKQPIVVRNSPGFVVNRLLLPQINEAIRLFEQGIATMEDIDSAIKLGLNHPMGPFQLADFIGLDICLNILEVLSSNLQNPTYAPASLLVDLVKQGKLGVKAGEGFYNYGGTSS
jgi:3-hydroxybutyryl-CoA dehydrogenase